MCTHAKTLDPLREETLRLLKLRQSGRPVFAEHRIQQAKALARLGVTPDQMAKDPTGEVFRTFGASVVGQGKAPKPIVGSEGGWITGQKPNGGRS